MKRMNWKTGTVAWVLLLTLAWSCSEDDDSENAGEQGAQVQEAAPLPGGQPGVQPGMVQPGMQPGTVQPGMQLGMVQPGVQPGMGQPGVQPGMGQPVVQPTAAEAPQGCTGDCAQCPHSENCKGKGQSGTAAGCPHAAKMAEGAASGCPHAARMAGSCASGCPHAATSPVAAELRTGETTSKPVTEAPVDGVYRGSTGELAVAWTVLPYFVVSGRTALTAEITGVSDMFRLELVEGDTVVAGMCPVTKMVDVSGIQPGIREVALKVTDKTGLVAATPSVPLVFAGAGAVLPLAEGIEAGRWAGWGQRTDDGQHIEGKVPHVKAHAQVPAGTKKLLVLVFWDEPESRRIGVDIGTGDCPHQGVRVGGAGGEGAKTIVPVFYEDSEGKDLAEGIWFVHIRVKDAAEHAKPFTFHYQFIAIP